MNGQTPSVETLDYEPMTDKIEEGPVLSLNGNGDDVGVAEAIHGPWWKSEYILYYSLILGGTGRFCLPLSLVAKFSLQATIFLKVYK